MIAGAALLLLLGAQNTDGKPSFDCARASHPLERTICRTPTLSALDAEVAQAYREKLALMFDRATLRTQQRNWQQILRTRCATSCAAADVERDYAVQLEFLRDLSGETFTANYKTSDISTLVITHLGPEQFAFTIRREELVGDPPLCHCALPATDGDAGPIATLVSPQKWRWREGGCTLDFTPRRDASGSVTGIAVTGSAGCKAHCEDKRFSLDDDYLPENGWVASNQ